MVNERIIIDKIKEIKKSLFEENDKQISLINGYCSDVVFFYQYAQFFPSKKVNDKLVSLLDYIIEKINDEEIDDSFSYGLPGVIWMLNLISDFKEIDFSDILEIDQAFQDELFEKAKKELLENQNYDLLRGAIGILLPLISQEGNVPLNNSIVKLFSIYFLKEIELNEFRPHSDFVNLGLAHGILSIISFISIIVKNDTNKKEAYQLVKSGIEIVNSYKTISKDTLSLFPCLGYKENEKNIYNSRLAWCYGDLGIANTYWLAGESFNKEVWKKEAINIGLHASMRRDVLENNVMDAGFCHGTAGIAHIFNKFYQRTHLREFDEARWYWLEKTLEFANFKDGLAGYKKYVGKSDFENKYGLLEGIAGIGVVLMGFLKSNESNNKKWDNCFLIS
jgi:lantibiotic modifying enzyme